MKRNRYIGWTLLIVITGLFLFGEARAAESDRDVVQMRGDVRVAEGERVRKAVALSGDVLVDGTVEESAVSLFGNVIVGPKGSILGEAVSLGGRVIRNGGRVEGKEVSMALPLEDGRKLLFLAVPMLAAVIGLLMAAVVVLSSVGYFVLVALVVALFERQVAYAQQAIVQYPGRSLGWGVLLTACLIPVLVLLTVSIVGIPLAFLVAAVAVAAIVLGLTAVSHFIGVELGKRFQWKLHPVWAGLLGFTLLFVVFLIPVVGFLTKFVVMFIGLGAVVQTRFRGAPPA